MHDFLRGLGHHRNVLHKWCLHTLRRHRLYSNPKFLHDPQHQCNLLHNSFLNTLRRHGLNEIPKFLHGLGHWHILLDLRHWQIHDKLPSTIMYALLWCELDTIHDRFPDLEHWDTHDRLHIPILHELVRHVLHIDHGILHDLGHWGTGAPTICSHRRGKARDGPAPPQTPPPLPQTSAQRSSTVVLGRDKQTHAYTWWVPIYQKKKLSEPLVR